ncbi:MAG: FAD-dependent oxidoreductase, partial [Candidatus Aminicenantes bacterium]|nr:FAD-dependent oxidoreductase [Candidatus Aminicenantes bacterium]
MDNNSGNFDIAVIGGGIVGMATAMTLKKKFKGSVVVLEAEDTLAKHQTGHNSGVIHSGLYYKPGSLKATNCKTGRELLYAFLKKENIPHDKCGKVVVATAEDQIPSLM